MRKVIPLTAANLKRDDNILSDNEDDDGKSDASSSLNSAHNKMVLTEEQKDSRDDARLAKKSAFIAHRNELRDKILKEVMEKVMPDAGAYDIDGMAKSKAKSKSGKFSKFMKLVGFLPLDLHEAVLTGSVKHTRKALKRIQTVNRANKDYIISIINQYDSSGRTALLIAVMINNLKLVDLLIEDGALADICDETSGRTPLMYSIVKRNLEMSNKLLNHGGSPHMSDYKCVTPLMLAASLNDLRHCKLLCKKFANVDDQDENGWTPLHYAVQGNAPDCIDYLLREGADRALRDINRRKPLDFAKFMEYGDCIAVLSRIEKIQLM